MPTIIEKPSIIKSAGNKPKIIEEFTGRVNSETKAPSIARMRSPGAWIEPRDQTPEFDEYTRTWRRGNISPFTCRHSRRKRFIGI